MLVSTYFSTAQNFPSFVGIRSGISVPFANFQSGTYINSNGYAKIGNNFTLEAAHFISDNVGFGGLVGVNIFNMDIERLTSEYIEDYSSISDITIETQPYVVNTYLFGFFFKAQVNNSLFSFTSKFLFGNLWVRNPEYIYNYQFSHLASFSIYQPKEIQSKFVFYYGLGSRVDITENLGLNFDIDYVSSKFTFDYMFMDKKYKINKRVSYIAFTLINVISQIQ